MKEEDKKYYLGLDIGIGSVGWAIIGEAGEEHWLESFGVHLFNVSEDPQNKKSWAEKRRGFRGKRKLLNRWHCRREDLKKFFFSLFVSNYPNLKKDFAEFAETKKTTNLLPGDLEKYEEKSKFFNPYIVRYQALSTKISLVDLLSILLHIGKCRGYKEFYLDSNLEEKDKEIKEAYAAVGEVKKSFQENNYRSVAEMVIKNEKFRHSQYKSLLSPHNHNPESIELNKLDKKSEKLSQDSQANEIIKQIIEEADKENLKWKKGEKYYDAIVGNKDKEIDGLDDDKLSNEKKKVKLQEIVADKFGKLNHKRLIFPRKFLEEEVQKILEKQSESECYPQLKRKFPYTLRVNGKIEIKELPAWEIIKIIIFRQRDFEDGPTETEPKSQEKKEIDHWKNIIVILLLLLLPKQLVTVSIFLPKEEVDAVRLFIVVINSLMSFPKLVI